MKEKRTSTEIITSDKRVKAMASAAGCWAPLRDAKRTGKATAVVQGLTLYASFEDGLVATTFTDPVELLMALARLSKRMGFRFAGLYEPGEVH